MSKPKFNKKPVFSVFSKYGLFSSSFFAGNNPLQMGSTTFNIATSNHVLNENPGFYLNLDEQYGSETQNTSFGLYVDESKAIENSKKFLNSGGEESTLLFSDIKQQKKGERRYLQSWGDTQDLDITTPKVDNSTSSSDNLTSWGDSFFREDLSTLPEDNSDVVQDNPDVVHHNSDLLEDNSDVVQDNPDVVHHNSDVEDNSDVLEENSDVVHHNSDVLEDNSDVDLLEDNSDLDSNQQESPQEVPQAPQEDNSQQDLPQEVPQAPSDRQNPSSDSSTPSQDILAQPTNFREAPARKATRKILRDNFSKMLKGENLSSIETKYVPIKGDQITRTNPDGSITKYVYDNGVWKSTSSKTNIPSTITPQNGDLLLNKTGQSYQLNNSVWSVATLANPTQPVTTKAVVTTPTNNTTKAPTTTQKQQTTTQLPTTTQKKQQTTQPPFTTKQSSLRDLNVAPLSAIKFVGRPDVIKLGQFLGASQEILPQQQLAVESLINSVFTDTTTKTSLISYFNGDEQQLKKFMLQLTISPNNSKVNAKYNINLDELKKFDAEINKNFNKNPTFWAIVKDLLSSLKLSLYTTLVEEKTGVSLTQQGDFSQLSKIKDLTNIDYGKFLDENVLIPAGLQLSPGSQVIQFLGNKGRSLEDFSDLGEEVLNGENAKRLLEQAGIRFSEGSSIIVLDNAEGRHLAGWTPISQKTLEGIIATLKQIENLSTTAANDITLLLKIVSQNNLLDTLFNTQVVTVQGTKYSAQDILTIAQKYLGSFSDFIDALVQTMSKSQTPAKKSNRLLEAQVNMFGKNIDPAELASATEQVVNLIEQLVTIQMAQKLASKTFDIRNNIIDSPLNQLLGPNDTPNFFYQAIFNEKINLKDKYSQLEINSFLSQKFNSYYPGSTFSVDSSFFTFLPTLSNTDIQKAVKIVAKDAQASYVVKNLVNLQTGQSSASLSANIIYVIYSNFLTQNNKLAAEDKAILTKVFNSAFQNSILFEYAVNAHRAQVLVKEYGPSLQNFSTTILGSSITPDVTALSTQCDLKDIWSLFRTVDGIQKQTSLNSSSNVTEFTTITKQLLKATYSRFDTNNKKSAFDPIDLKKIISRLVVLLSDNNISSLLSTTERETILQILFFESLINSSVKTATKEFLGGLDILTNLCAQPNQTNSELLFCNYVIRSQIDTKKNILTMGLKTDLDPYDINKAWDFVRESILIDNAPSSNPVQ